MTSSNDFTDAFREDALNTLDKWGGVCADASTLEPEEIYTRLMRCAHNLKGNAGLMGLDTFSAAVHRIEDALQNLNKKGSDPKDPQTVALFYDIEAFLRDWVINVCIDLRYQPPALAVVERLESWNPLAGNPEPAIGAPTEPAAFVPTVKKIELDSSKHQDENIQLPSKKLDNLIHLVGELTLAQSIVSRGFQDNTLGTTQVRDALKMSEKLSVDLRQAVLDLRMLPMAGLFTRLERAAAELGVRLGKPFHFFTTGHNVSVDKAVLTRIFDPLLHILRNACDHGLEPQEERKAAGKTGPGVVRIEASVKSGGVIIQVTDDGRGINTEKVRAKGIEKGLITEDQKLTEQELFSLIFRPGFSTAEKVTDVSGRGVGMDVVLKEIRMLSGQIEVYSEVGKGSKFTIHLPSNISLVETFIISAASSFFAVPTHDVLEIIDLNDYRVESSSMHKKMIRLRDEIVPLVPLGKFLKFENILDTNNTDQSYALIVRTHSQSMGILINEVIGQQQVFVRPLTGLLSQFPWISGSTILSNGEPAVIVNTKEIANNFFMHYDQRETRNESAKK